MDDEGQEDWAKDFAPLVLPIGHKDSIEEDCAQQLVDVDIESLPLKNIASSWVLLAIVKVVLI